MNGYAGKILRLNLTERRVSTIPTSKYQHWMGGHGMGSAIFFDLVKDKTIDGFHPANGYPTRAALEPLGLGYVADELEKNGKLGGK